MGQRNEQSKIIQIDLLECPSFLFPCRRAIYL